MSTEESNRELATLAHTLKERLQAGCRPAGKRPGRNVVQVSHELHQELLATLDTLAHAIEATESISKLDATDNQNTPQGSSAATRAPELAGPQSASPDLVSERVVAQVNEAVASAIDQSMAAWQANLTCTFEQTATRELQQRLEAAIQLTNSLHSQQQLLNQQRETYERELRDTLELRARLIRQRKQLACQFRLQRKEIAQLHATATANQQLARDTEHERLRTRLDQVENELVDAQSKLADAQHSLATNRQAGHQWETRENNLLAEIELLTSEVNDRNQALNELRVELNSSRDELANSKSEAAESSTDLSTLHNALHELREELLQAHEAASNATECQRVTTRELANAKEEIELLEEALVEANERQQVAVDAECDPDNQQKVDQLEQQLYTQQVELMDLRNQNMDLAAQVTKLQMAAPSLGHTRKSINQEAMSWEERKAIILQQLDDECEVSGDAATAVRQSAEEMLDATQREIERRDREIAELQRLVEQQAGARDGVAIGAAAIAQILDTDQLIAQERQKLKDIQREWEDKLRQAEIDLSMERAKLARERIQVELQLEEAKAAETTHQENLNNRGQPRTRKWLEHLGLRDNKGE